MLERLGVERPIVQAGMGGGIARHELAAAVSEAGGLGTIGILDPRALEDEIAAARRLTARPVAVNLLLPFATRRHRRAVEQADVIVTFWGRPRRPAGRAWLHQCGSLEEAREARAAGADGVIAQGLEAGGHVRGTRPALDLVADLRRALPGFPVWLAGGVAEREDVATALARGAEAAVLGTRFLLSAESRAHPAYVESLLAARRTLLTELFGLGWPAAPHRVVANEATRRWVGKDGRLPGWLKLLHRLGTPAIRALSDSFQQRLAAGQRPRAPLLAPVPPTDDGPASLVEAGPLYAGETVARIEDVRPAAELVQLLTP